MSRTVIFVFFALLLASASAYHSLSDVCRNSSFEKSCGTPRNRTEDHRGNFASVVIENPRRVKKNPDSFRGSGAFWYAKIPLLPVLFADSPTIPEGNCKRHAIRYLEELRNGTLWAVQMFDSSTKYPDGVLTGHTRHFGNFDGCYELRTKIPRQQLDIEAEDEEIGGRYCLVKVAYTQIGASRGHPKGPHTLQFDTSDSVWEAIKEKGDFRRVKRYVLELALCVPDSCSGEEIKQALEHPLKEIGLENDLLVDVNIRGSCQAQNDRSEMSTLGKVYCYAILSLVLLVAASTWYDSASPSAAAETKSSLMLDLFLCFSARRNYRSFKRSTYSHPALDCIHIYRVMFMFFVIFGHRLMQYYTNPTMNAQFLEFTYTLPISILLYNGPIIVEAFFGFGGLLLAYYLLLELEKKGKVSFLAAIIFRYIRLTPSYGVLMMFIALVLPHLGAGPNWNSKVDLESESCLTNWWANLLYINNYVNPDKLCMFQSWYLSADYHLYIISLFAVYAFWKMPRRFGYPFLGALVFIGCLLPFLISFYYKTQPMFKGLPYMQEVREDPYFINHYIKTHERLPSYFIGVLGGAIIYDHRNSAWRISKRLAQLLFLCCWATALTSSYLGLKYYDPNSHPSTLETALYASLSRPGFAFAIVAGVVVLTVGKDIEGLHRLHQPSWAQPISKLTYGVFLVHNINQVYDIGVRRVARVFTVHNMIWDMIPEVVMSFFLAFVIAIVIEGPFRNIEKRLLRREAPKSKNQ